MIYGIHDNPKTIKEWVLYATQQLMSVFVATVLIAQICGTPVNSCLVGASVGTLVYQIITGFNSPMFISSCGATCSAVIGALSVSPYIMETFPVTYSPNYAPVVIGGFVIFVVYAVFSLIVKLRGIESINRIFPPIIVGPVTMVIGLNLATFIPTYVSVQDSKYIGVIVALLTMCVVAVTSHYFKGFLKTIPFLIGLIFGYVVCVVLTVFNISTLVDFSLFEGMHLFSVPDFTWKYIDFSLVSWKSVFEIIVLFLPVAICPMLEHYSDHTTMSNIIGVDLTKNPGLHRTLLGDGVASFLGTVICGLPNTSYGESIATTGFSKVASTKVITLAAVLLGVLAFIEPVQVFIQSIPSCVFGGCAMILYGYIAASGLKTLLNSELDLSDNKNLVIVSVILTIGVSGVCLFNESFAGVSLAMVVGVILNIILRGTNEKSRQN